MAIKIRQNGTWQEVEAKNPDDCVYHIQDLKISISSVGSTTTSFTGTGINTSAKAYTEDVNGVLCRKQSIDITCGFNPRIVIPYYYHYTQGNYDASILNPISLLSSGKNAGDECYTATITKNTNGYNFSIYTNRTVAGNFYVTCIAFK